MLNQLSDDERRKLLKAEKLLRMSRKDLLSFTRFTMPKYQANWHHRIISEHIMQWAFGDIDRLMIFTPPRHGKSELVSRRTPPFILGHKPDAQIVVASYADRLASKMNVAAQRIISSPAYRALFPKIKIPSKGDITPERKKRTNNFVELINDEGFIISTGTRGTLTGEGANYLIIDDPFKNGEECQSQTIRDSVYDWWQSTAETRLEDPGKVMLTMTRWHDDDLAGRLLNDDPDGWTVLRLPAIADGELHKDDPREHGEALWESKYSLKRLKRKKETTPSRWWEPMYQQNPVPEAGAIIKREWWKYYGAAPNFQRVIQVWDCAHKVGIDNDFSVCATWGETDNGFYLIDVWRNKVEAPELERAALSLYNRNKPSAVVIEDKAAGIGLIQSLRRQRIPVIAYNPGSKDKVIRAINASPQIEAGNCYLPEKASWVEDFVTEHQRFPSAVHDDQVDTTSMAIDFMNTSKASMPRVRLL
jgi:predicted phage terminase large subunit-like protein